MLGPDAELMAAATRGDNGSVSALIANGADASFQDTSGRSILMAAAASGDTRTVQLLLEAGAPWNAFDKTGRCAGEYALDAGHTGTVDALLEAGIRAELILGAVERATGRSEEIAASTSYLQDRVVYTEGADGGEVLMDPENKAVMMEWEAPLMEAHAQAICSRGGDILNVGFGLGLIDEAIQRRLVESSNSEASAIVSHTIIEAHPGVYARMQALGWDKKPGVKIIFGRWQEVQDQLQEYDGIFFDTYSEYYEDLREFHARLPKLLKKEGLYSFFNGLAADNSFFHLVYCEICKRELAQLGLDTQYVQLRVSVMKPATWKAIRNKYWQLDTYFLPVAEWRED